MKYLQAILVAVLMIVAASTHAWGADITGTWKASFDTQIGQQNYTYTFVVKGTTLTGKIQSEMGGTTQILEGKVDGDKVSFVEIFKYGGMEVRISYSGQSLLTTRSSSRGRSRRSQPRNSWRSCCATKLGC